MSMTLADPAERRDPLPEPSRPPHAPASAAGPLKQLMLRLHFYVGVLVGPFLLVAAVSGAFYAIAPAAEQVLYRSQLTASTPAQAVPLTTQVATARERHPDLDLSGVVPGADGATTRVLFSDPSLPSSSYSRVVFLDPSDGAVRGDTVQYGSGQALPLRTWISELHKNLHLGEPGRVYSELAASWLAPLALGGLWLWWSRRRRTGAPMFRAGTRSIGRPRTRTRHAVAGTWAVAGLLVLSATGLTWSEHAGGNVGDLRTAMNWGTPALDKGVPAAGSAGSAGTAGSAGHDGHGSHSAGQGAPAGAPSDPATGVEDALAAARTAGLQDPMLLTPPAAEGAPWRVKESRRSWTAGPDAVSVDAATGEVVQRIDFADFPLAAKLTDWGIRVHMGFLFGLANQLALAALGVVLVGIVLRGYAMWWMRRPGPGRPPTRGALRELVRRRPLATGAAALVVGAVGWAVPLLGISLVVFLVVDALVGAVRGRGTARADA